jgi:ribose/xylose/arabinose/galactoside ABC-type transport system permease subunit
MKKFLKIYMERPELAGLALLVLLTIFFQLKSGGVFLNGTNLQGMLSILPEMTLVALGVTILMICGEFDLSVGSVFALTPMAIAIMLNGGIPFPVALFLGLLLAAGIGFANGFITIRFSIPSFITTLGMLFVARSLTVDFRRLPAAAAHRYSDLAVQRLRGAGQRGAHVLRVAGADRACIGGHDVAHQFRQLDQGHRRAA